MRALMISPAMPAMTGGGLSMRMGLFLHGLGTIAETDLLVLPLGGLPKNQEQLDRYFKATCKIVPITGREDSLFKLVSRVQDKAQRLEAFRRYGRGSLAATLSAAVLADVATATAGQSYDIIHVGRSYLAEAALSIKGHAARSLDADENDAEMFRRQAALELAAGDDDQSAFHFAEADACDRQQSAVLGKFDLVFASSEREAQSLLPYREGRPLIVVPNAVIKPKPAPRQDDGRTLLFVGSLGFWPNKEGLQWFVREVWPLLLSQTKHPLRLRIVGRDCPTDIQRLSNIAGISVHPDVANPDDFYAQATIAIVPLRAGGGTRIKIIEAAMHGVPVVSTRLGAEGLCFEDGREIFLAEGASHLASQISLALENPAHSQALAQRAMTLAQSEYGYEAISHQLACNWKDLLAKGISQN